ncbi:MAG TPA: sulfur transferase domain-containing protein, partial [Thermoanaerobaculia bacterium]
RGFDERETATQIGLTYVNIPVTPATLDQATIDRFLNAFRKAERPLLLHCSNASRVGGLLYAWLVLEKKEPPAKALERARAAGLRGPEMTEKVQKLVAERQATSAKPAARPHG